MTQTHINENVEIEILPSEGRTYSAEEEQRIRQAIRDHLLLKRSEPYHSVSVQAKYAEDGNLQALVAYLRRQYTYTADVFTVWVDSDCTVKRIDTGLTVNP